jgi:hypothetical protein
MAGSRRVASRRAFTGRGSSTSGFAARSIQPAEAEHPWRAFREIMRWSIFRRRGRRFATEDATNATNAEHDPIPKERIMP